MAHELEFDKLGKAMMAYAGETPWHGLGTPVSNDLTPDEFMKVANLDWEVEKAQNYYNFRNEQRQAKNCSLIRTTDGKELSVVSSDWEIVQNREAFDFFQEFVEAGDMEMHTAGSLKEGRRVWILAKMKDSFEIEGVDRVDPYLLFTNPHEYGHVVDIRFTPVRAVCNNTVQFALDGEADLVVKLNHRKKFDPAWAKGVLGLAQKKMKLYQEQAEFLCSRRNPGGKEMMAYLKTVFPPSSAVEAKQGVSRAAKLALCALTHQPGREFKEGSMWQLFNACTFTIDHLLHQKNPENRLTTAWYGYNRKRKLVALTNAVKMAKTAPALETV